MEENTIIGKVFEGRTIDRVTQLDNSLIEIGFTDSSFERVHSNDFADFCVVLGVVTEEVVPEVTEEVVPEVIEEVVPVVTE